MSVTKPVEIFPPERWLDCSDCDETLTLSAIATGTDDTLLAARMLCRNHEDPTRIYVSEKAMGDIYFDTVPDVKPAFEDVDDEW